MGRFVKHLPSPTMVIDFLYRLIRYRPSPAIVLAFIALSVALAGSASALQGRRVVKADDLATASVGKRAIRANGVGKSELGRTRANGLRLWGVIDTDGSLVRGAGVTSTSRTAAGAYHVVFNQDVSDCGYLATLGRTGAEVAQGGEIGTGGLPETPNGVWVRTRDSAGNLTDLSFHIAIAC
jgi:hypothetical protein